MKRRKPARERREIQLRFRGAPLDQARLEALARRDELTVSEVLRRLVREECVRKNVNVKGE